MKTIKERDDGTIRMTFDEYNEIVSICEEVIEQTINPENIDPRKLFISIDIGNTNAVNVNGQDTNYIVPLPSYEEVIAMRLEDNMEDFFYYFVYLAEVIEPTKYLSQKAITETVIGKRREKRLSLEELSQKTGIKVATLLKLEAGEYDPPFDRLMALSNALDFSPYAEIDENAQKLKDYANSVLHDKISWKDDNNKTKKKKIGTRKYTKKKVEG